MNDVDLAADDIVERQLAKRSPKFGGEKKLKKLLKKKLLIKLPLGKLGAVGLGGSGAGGLGGALGGVIGPQALGALPFRSINGLPFIGRRKKRSANPKLKASIFVKAPLIYQA